MLNRILINLTRQSFMVTEQSLYIAHCKWFSTEYNSSFTNVKRPPTPYARYLQESMPVMREKFPYATNQELFQLIAANYRQLSETEINLRKAEYQYQLEAFKSNANNRKALDKASKIYKSKKRRARRAGLPRRAPTSPMAVYLSEQLKDANVQSLQEANAKYSEVAANWKILSADEQKIYAQKLQVLKEKVKNDIQAWAESQKLPRPQASYKSIVLQYSAKKSHCQRKQEKLKQETKVRIRKARERMDLKTRKLIKSVKEQQKNELEKRIRFITTGKRRL